VTTARAATSKRFADTRHGITDRRSRHVDSFHSYSPTEPWWTETVWFGAWIRRRHHGLFLQLVPPVAGIYGGGCLSGRSRLLPWDIPVYRYEVNAPITAPVDMRDMRLPTGTWLKCVEPGMVYDMGYQGSDARLEMRFEGILPPTRPPRTHFGILRGTSTSRALHRHARARRRRHRIDCHGIRDRSWGRASSVTTSAWVLHGPSKDFAFLAYSTREANSNRVQGLRDAGRPQGQLKEGHRRVCYHGGSCAGSNCGSSTTLDVVNCRRPLKPLSPTCRTRTLTWLFLMEWEGRPA